MRNSVHSGDGGQTLIWVAITMVVLLGLASLAVDVGHLYSERRHMQNAADAGALEAARARCFDNATAAAAAAKGAAFTQANNSRPDALDQGYAVVPRAANDREFDSTAWEVVRVFFGGVIGVAPVRVEVTAAAACGPTDRACGMFPLALSENIWDQVKNQCGQTFFVWTSDKDKQNADDTIEPPNCTTCDCTKVYVKNKLVGGAIAIADVGRAWLDFTSSIDPALNPSNCGGSNGCGTNELKCWVRESSPVVILKNSCVSGTQGVKLGVRNEVNDREGDYVNIPIFSGECTPDEAGGCGGGFTISDFGCVQVQHWANQKVELYLPGTEPKKANECFSGQMMPVKVACDKCDTTCGHTTGGGDPGSGIKAINLIK